MTTITKAYKIKLIKPVEDNWEFVGEVLNNLDYITKRLKNKGATTSYINIINKLNNQKTLKPSEIIKQVKTELNEELKCKNFAQSTVETAIREAINKVSTDFKEIAKGEKTLSNYKDNQPIPTRAQQIKIEKEGKDYYISIGLLSRDYATELGRKGKDKARIKFLASAKGNEKIIMDRIISGEYKLCDSNIQKQGKSWYLIATYQFEKKDKIDLIPNKILGLDMGISKAVVMAVSDSPVWDSIEGGEIEQFRNKVEYRRNQMRNQLKWCSDNRKGHGRNTLLKPLEVLESKVSDFRKLTNHRYAKYVVDFAVKNKCSIIQMEDLSGINTRSAFLKRWSYFDLQTKIESKAKEYGIEVRKVDPKFTSQRCNNCGVISKDNRPNQETYQCTCQRKTRNGMKTYKTNADLNAARNIAIDGIEDIIYEQALYQGLIKPKKSKKKVKKAS